MEQAKFEELKNDLQDIRKMITQHAEELNQLEQDVNKQTLNWTGEARQRKLDQEKEIAKIEFKDKFDRLVNSFNKKLQAESENEVFEYIEKSTGLNDLKEMADKLKITLGDFDNLVYDQARITEPELLIRETDTFSKLVLKKQLVIGMLPSDIKRKVILENRIAKNDLYLLKELENGRDFLIGRVARPIEELKQFNLEQLFERNFS